MSQTSTSLGGTLSRIYPLAAGHSLAMASEDRLAAELLLSIGGILTGLMGLRTEQKASEAVR